MLDASPQPLIHTTTTLPQERTEPVAVAVGTKVIFADGFTGEGSPDSNAVDVYDSTTGQWSSSTMPHTGRTAGVAVGGKAIFVGSAHGAAPTLVDIYDPVANAWSTATVPNLGSHPAATVVGDKAIFVAGEGDASKTTTTAVIYDAAANTWYTQTMPLPSDGVGVSAGGRAFFMAEKDLDYQYYDVYDAATGRWSVRQSVGGEPVGAIGTKVFFGGGANGTYAVYDTVTDRATLVTAPAQFGVWGQGGTALGTKFVIGYAWPPDSHGVQGWYREVAAYDLSTGQWSVAPTRSGGLPVSVGTQALIADGTVPPDNVDIYTDPTPTPVLSGGIAARARGKVTVTLYNTGDADQTGPYTVNVYATPPHRLTGAVLLGSVQVQQPLPAGASTRVQLRITVPSGTPAGTYHLVAGVAQGGGQPTSIAGGVDSFTLPSSTPATIGSALPATQTAPAFSTRPHRRRSWLADGGA